MEQALYNMFKALEDIGCECSKDSCNSCNVDKLLVQNARGGGLAVSWEQQVLNGLTQGREVKGAGMCKAVVEASGDVCCIDKQATHGVCIGSTAQAIPAS